jgi:hypothetical protein
MSRKLPKAGSSFRPALEGLEDRTVPTVTFHGGAVLPHVKVQALYLGPMWGNVPQMYREAQYLDGFLNSLVHSSYMDALTNAGYGVGRGSFTPGKIDPLAQPDPELFDFRIQFTLFHDIADHTLQSPDANTLYVIFVEPSVTHGAYHSGWSRSPAPGQVGDMMPPARYAVIPLDGGGDVTKTASQEIADAVTDPDRDFGQAGWYENYGFGHGEIGDVLGDPVMYLNGYSVQRVVNKDHFVMTPAQATPSRAVNFVLRADGNLVEITAAGTTPLLAGVAAVSDQGIDNQGHAMVDVLDKLGNAWEFHDGGAGTWTRLGSGVKSAKAGQGVSYVLYNNGNVFEYDDATGTSRFVRGSVTQIDAGTDVQGVNAVDVIVPGQLVAKAAAGVGGGGIVFQPTNAYEYSDDSGAHFIASGVQSISAGRQGYAAYVTTAGLAFAYTQSTGDTSQIWATAVAQVTIGTDPTGHYMIDLLQSNGVLWESRPYDLISWYTVAAGVKNVSKARLGAVDVVITPSPVVKSMSQVVGTAGPVFGSPNAWEHTLAGWRFLSSNATAAV